MAEDEQTDTFKQRRVKCERFDIARLQYKLGCKLAMGELERG